MAQEEMFPIVPHLGEKSAMKNWQHKDGNICNENEIEREASLPPFPCRTCCPSSSSSPSLPLPLFFSLCFLCSVLFAVFPQKKKHLCTFGWGAFAFYFYYAHSLTATEQGREREWEWVCGRVGQRAQRSQWQATLNWWLPCSRTRGADAARAEVRLNVGPINVPPQRLLLLLLLLLTHASFHTFLPLPLPRWSSSLGILFGLWVGQIIIIIIIPRAVCSCRLAISTSCLPSLSSLFLLLSPPLLVCYIKTSVATLQGSNSNSSSRSGADKHIVISEGSSLQHYHHHDHHNHHLSSAGGGDAWLLHHMSLQHGKLSRGTAHRITQRMVSFGNCKPYFKIPQRSWRQLSALIWQKLMWEKQ